MTNRYIPPLPHLTWDREAQAHIHDVTRRVNFMFCAYLECAEWADKPEEEDWSEAVFSTEAMDLAWFDCCAFLRVAGYAIHDWDMNQLGRDFWLTRNHHGAGFWDRDFGTEEERDRLTKLAHALGECSIYKGDDGYIHLC